MTSGRPAFRPFILVLLAAVVLALVPAARAAGRGESGPEIYARVDLPDFKADLHRLDAMGVDIDAVFDGWARVVLVEEEIGKLRLQGFKVTLLGDEPRFGLPGAVTGPTSAEPRVPALYHTYETLTTDLQQVATDHPDIVRLSSIGQSVQGRELWMVEISDNPDTEEDEPEVAYISSMHGDEVVGKEMCYDFIDYLVSNYGTDARVTDLIDNNEIWIMPSMNPDGTALGQRYNANGYDLNRNFPDQFIDPVNTTAGRQPETAAVMDWQAPRRIVIKANFHGGELIANYPFDSNSAGASVFSPTPDPDHDTFVSISRTYADNNIPMSMNNSGPSFDNGITNGAAWYSINGGMQDWSYVWNGAFEITLEIGTIKWPSATTLPGFWDDNLESMLSYLERAQGGVRGLVTDAETGLPLAATVLIDADPFPVYTDPDVGDYHRMVQPGNYTLHVSALGYADQSIPVTVTSGPAARYDVALAPLPTMLEPAGSRVEDGASGNGALDPGESDDLAVTLENLGRAATGVQGRLVPASWGTAVDRGDATYPDVGVGESVESDAPYYGVSVDPAVPPGRKVGFAVAWSAAEGSGMTDPFFLDVGAATCEKTPATDVPQPILDYQTTTSHVTVTTAVTVEDLQVPVNLTHTYIGDLRLVLTSPLGTQVVLHNRTGGTTDNIVGTYGDDLTPAEPLSAFDGEPVAGTWKLEVSDQAGGDTGTLNSWSLWFCGHPADTATPEILLREVTRGPGSVTVSWWPYPGLDSYHVYRATDPSSAGAFVEVTGSDPDPTDTAFEDAAGDPLVFWLVTGDGPLGEGPKGHFGQ